MNFFPSILDFNWKIVYFYLCVLKNNVYTWDGQTFNDAYVRR